LQAKYWVEYLRNAQLNGLDNQKVQIAFVGNKTDLEMNDERQREVQLKEAQVIYFHYGKIQIFLKFGKPILKKAKDSFKNKF